QIEHVEHGPDVFGYGRQPEAAPLFADVLGDREKRADAGRTHEGDVGQVENQAEALCVDLSAAGEKLLSRGGVHPPAQAQDRATVRSRSVRDRKGFTHRSPHAASLLSIMARTSRMATGFARKA